MLCNTPGAAATLENVLWLHGVPPIESKTDDKTTKSIETTPKIAEDPYYVGFDETIYLKFEKRMDEVASETIPNMWEEFYNSYGNKKSALCRFLTARDGNIEKALNMITTTYEFRLEHDVSGCITSNDLERLAILEAIRNYWTATFFGLTEDGSPIQYHRIEYLRPSILMKSPKTDENNISTNNDGIGGEKRMRIFYLWWMETSLSLQRIGYTMLNNNMKMNEEMKLTAKPSSTTTTVIPDQPMPQGIEIFDLKGVSWWTLSGALSGLRMFSRALSVGQDHYPENLRKAYVLNAPSIITILWSVVLIVLSERTKSKIYITNHDNRKQLLEFMTEKMMNDMFESTNSFHPDIVDCVEKEKKARLQKLSEEIKIVEGKEDGEDEALKCHTGSSDSMDTVIVSESVHIEDVEVDEYGFKTLSV